LTGISGGSDQTLGLSGTEISISGTGGNSVNLRNMSDASNNLMLGLSSGVNISTGFSNTFYGTRTGEANTEGSGNVFIGHNAGNDNTTGGSNIFIGNSAGTMNTTGESNVSVGTSSGVSLDDGTNNTFVGQAAGFSVVSGTGNIFLGANAGQNETGSNKLYIENSSSSSPLIYGELDNDIVAINGKLGIGTSSPFGIFDLQNENDGTIMFRMIRTTNSTSQRVRLNLQKGKGTLSSPTSVVNGDELADILASGYVDGSYENGASIGFEVDDDVTSGYPPTSIYFSTRDGIFNLRRLVISSNGNVGIGRTATSNLFEVDGDASKDVAGDWLANSDKRIKTDIKEIRNSFELMKALRPVKFKYTEYWREQNPSITDKYYFNFIAQEFQEVFPEAVKGSGEFIEGDPEEILQIDTYNAQITTIQAVKDLIAIVEQLQQENASLKSKNSSLEQRVSSMEASLDRIEQLLEVHKKSTFTGSVQGE
jgi:hypothetical protein